LKVAWLLLVSVVALMMALLQDWVGPEYTAMDLGSKESISSQWTVRQASAIQEMSAGGGDKSRTSILPQIISSQIISS
jgi:hypothetical protein